MKTRGPGGRPPLPLRAAAAAAAHVLLAVHAVLLLHFPQLLLLVLHAQLAVVLHRVVVQHDEVSAVGWAGMRLCEDFEQREPAGSLPRLHAALLNLLQQAAAPRLRGGGSSACSLLYCSHCCLRSQRGRRTCSAR